MYQSFYLTMFLFIHLLSIYVSIYLSIYLFIYLSNPYCINIYPLAIHTQVRTFFFFSYSFFSIKCILRRTKKNLSFIAIVIDLMVYTSNSL